MFHVGDVVRKLRDERRWSQTRLGKEAGFDKDTIRRLEAGENTRADTLEKIAVAMGRRPGDLLALVDRIRSVSAEDYTAPARPTLRVSDSTREEIEAYIEFKLARESSQREAVPSQAPSFPDQRVGPATRRLTAQRPRKKKERRVGDADRRQTG